MTTRKALIERIQSMQLGTQEMLDAAKDDATLIPFETLFLNSDDEVVWRNNGFADDILSVHAGSCYVDASELRPITEE